MLTLDDIRDADYDPESYDSRVELATYLDAKLTEWGFAPIKLPKTRERVYAREQGDNLECRVYSTIDGRQTRALAKDAIRVCLVYTGGDKPRGCGKDRRVYRVGVVGEIATRVRDRIERITEGLELCKKCGAPTFKSRRGNQVCAALCWTKDKPNETRGGGLSVEARTALAGLVDYVMGHGYQLDQVAGQDVQDNALICRMLSKNDAGPELAKHGLAGRRVDYGEGQGYVWVTERGVRSYLKAKEAGLLAA